MSDYSSFGDVDGLVALVVSLVSFVLVFEMLLFEAPGKEGIARICFGFIGVTGFKDLRASKAELVN